MACTQRSVVFGQYLLVRVILDSKESLGNSVEQWTHEWEYETEPFDKSDHLEQQSRSCCPDPTLIN